MKIQLKEIYTVEMLGGYTLAVCLSRREALDAKTYFTRIIGYSPKTIVIREGHAYDNGWHRELLDHHKQMQEGGTK